MKKFPIELGNYEAKDVVINYNTFRVHVLFFYFFYKQTVYVCVHAKPANACKYVRA